MSEIPKEWKRYKLANKPIYRVDTLIYAPRALIGCNRSNVQPTYQLWTVHFPNKAQYGVKGIKTNQLTAMSNEDRIKELKEERKKTERGATGLREP